MGCDKDEEDEESYRIFLLTHPVWDVTVSDMKILILLKFLLTHPVWDVTLIQQQKQKLQNISTHTSRVGCDFSGLLTGITGLAFLLTHPVWDVTRSIPAVVIIINISTHTSRVGCDAVNIVSLSHTIISTHTSRVGCDVGLGVEETS